MAGRDAARKASSFPVLRLWRDRHEVSILIATVGAVGRYRGVLPRLKVSMMIMRPPQHGQGCERVGGLSPAVASAGWVGRLADGRALVLRDRGCNGSSVKPARMISAGWLFVRASSALGSRNNSSGKELGQSPYIQTWKRT